MNDFTKDELIEILLVFNESIVSSTQPESTHVLRDKIQLMVDKYCEHSWAFYISPHGNAVRCNKCNKGIPQ